MVSEWRRLDDVDQGKGKVGKVDSTPSWLMSSLRQEHDGYMTGKSNPSRRCYTPILKCGLSTMSRLTLLNFVDRPARDVEVTLFVS